MLNMNTVRYPRHIGIQHKITFELTENLYVIQWVVPKGTKIITWQTNNFGWVKIPSNTRDDRTGHPIPRTLFNY